MSNTCATTDISTLNAILIDNRRQLEIRVAQIGTMDSQVETGNRHVLIRDRHVGSMNRQVDREVVIGTDK